MIPQARSHRGPPIPDAPTEPKGTVSICGGVGGVVGVFAGGGEACVGFDRRGMGLYGATKSGKGMGLAVGGSIGVSFSDKESVADLAGTDDYVAVSGPIKPGLGGEASWSPGQMSFSAGPGFGVDKGVTGGRSTTYPVWWRSYGEIFSPPGLNG
ncbi:MAG: hypothetical protein ABIQ18_14615 [Umezawaea sp.]